MPIPGWQVIPDGWSDHHRPTASATMLGTCSITRPTVPTAYNATTLQYTAPTPSTIYSGPCRVLKLPRRESPPDFGDRQTFLTRYQVSIQWDAAEVLIDDQVTVTDAPDDQLVGKVMRVTGVQRGTEQWQRDLTCELTET